MSFNIWNNLDEIGLFLGIKRMDSETNEALFNRIRMFGRWKYKTDYLSQVHSIPIQTGLLTTPVVKIFSDYQYECTIDWEYFSIKNEKENVRIYINNSKSTLDKILSALDNTETFTYSLYDEAMRHIPLKLIVRNSNLKMTQDYVDKTNFNLTYQNIKQGTLKSIDSGVLITEKNSIADLKVLGDYFIDLKTGYIQILSQDFPGTFVTYKYYDSTFMIEATELNLVPTNIKFKYGITDECVDIIPFLLSNQVWG